MFNRKLFKTCFLAIVIFVFNTSALAQQHYDVNACAAGITSMCPLPKNFNWIISCCSNSDKARKVFIKNFQGFESSRLSMLISGKKMRESHFISEKTYQKILDYSTWSENLNNKKIKDWDIEGLRSGEMEVNNAIDDDDKTYYRDKFLCVVSSKFCR